MAAKDTVKVGPEYYVYTGTTAAVGAKLTFNATTHAVTDTTVGGDWTLLAYSRLPISYSEPRTLTDVYKNFKIDHIKKGREQRKTLSIRKAYTNFGESFRSLLDTDFYIMIEVKPDDGTATERTYFRGVRILTPSNEIGDEEATESIECVYAESGYKDLTT